MPTSATETVTAHVRDASAKPPTWTNTSPVTSATANAGPGLPRRLTISTHFPTFTAAPAKQ